MPVDARCGVANRHRRATDGSSRRRWCCRPRRHRHPPSTSSARAGKPRTANRARILKSNKRGTRYGHDYGYRLLVPVRRRGRLRPHITWCCPPAATRPYGWPSASTADVVWPSTDQCCPQLPGGKQYTLAADAPSAPYVAIANLCVAFMYKKVSHGTPCPASFGGSCLGLFGMVISL